ncbi:hypothetical protein EJB05_57664 [Eragrostis curvula]|uniref:Ubiquitin-like protease family profile domain-containing protein n=1 Tax=Eragrostis curvula TaxID=38414 RepID=A0A5J9SE70_9POAL|nr:hypothetical protein EJB05_57664 [Eragrostis curvula]
MAYSDAEYSDNESVNGIEDSEYECEAGHVDGAANVVGNSEDDIDDATLVKSFKILRRMTKQIASGIGRQGVSTRSTVDVSNVAAGPSKPMSVKANSRCNQSYFKDVIMALNDHQKQVVTDYGFGDLLQFDGCPVPRRFVQWIADHIDEKCHDIHVNGEVFYLDHVKFGPNVTISNAIPRISVWKGSMVKKYSSIDCVSNNVFGKRPVINGICGLYECFSIQRFAAPDYSPDQLVIEIFQYLQDEISVADNAETGNLNDGAAGNSNQEDPHHSMNNNDGNEDANTEKLDSDGDYQESGGNNICSQATVVVPSQECFSEVKSSGQRKRKRNTSSPESTGSVASRTRRRLALNAAKSPLSRPSNVNVDSVSQGSKENPVMVDESVPSPKRVVLEKSIKEACDEVARKHEEYNCTKLRQSASVNAVSSKVPVEDVNEITRCEFNKKNVNDKVASEGHRVCSASKPPPAAGSFKNSNVENAEASKNSCPDPKVVCHGKTVAADFHEKASTSSHHSSGILPKGSRLHERVLSAYKLPKANVEHNINPEASQSTASNNNSHDKFAFEDYLIMESLSNTDDETNEVRDVSGPYSAQPIGFLNNDGEYLFFIPLGNLTSTSSLHKVSDYLLGMLYQSCKGKELRDYAVKSFNGANSARKLYNSNLLYFPIFYRNHWLLIVVDLKNRCYLYLEPDCANYGPDSAYHRQMKETFAKNFFAIWEQTVQLDCGIPLLKGPYFVDVPQQLNENDGGVFILKLLEVFEPNVNLHQKFTQVDIRNIRKKFVNEMIFAPKNEMVDSVELVKTYKPEVYAKYFAK